MVMSLKNQTKQTNIHIIENRNMCTPMSSHVHRLMSIKSWMSWI